jgi:hypothetical protein
VYGIVGSVVQTSALLALQSPTGNQVTYVNHITELTDVLRSFDTLKKAFGLLVEHIQTVPGTMQAQV